MTASAVAGEKWPALRNHGRKDSGIQGSSQRLERSSCMGLGALLFAMGAGGYAIVALRVKLVASTGHH